MTTLSNRSKGPALGTGHSQSVPQYAVQHLRKTECLKSILSERKSLARLSIYIIGLLYCNINKDNQVHPRGKTLSSTQADHHTVDMIHSQVFVA